MENIVPNLSDYQCLDLPIQTEQKAQEIICNYLSKTYNQNNSSHIAEIILSKGQKSGAFDECTAVAPRSYA